MKKYLGVVVSVFVFAASVHSMGRRPDANSCNKSDSGCRHEERGQRHIRESLGLTDEQMEKFRALRIEAEKVFKEEREALRAERKFLEELKGKGQLTKEKVKESIGRMGAIQQKMHTVRLKNASDAIDILSNEQLEKAIDKKIMEPFFGDPSGRNEFRKHKRMKKD